MCPDQNLRELSQAVEIRIIDRYLSLSLRARAHSVSAMPGWYLGTWRRMRSVDMVKPQKVR